MPRRRGPIAIGNRCEPGDGDPSLAAVAMGDAVKCCGSRLVGFAGPYSAVRGKHTSARSHAGHQRRCGVASPVLSLSTSWNNAFSLREALVPVRAYGMLSNQRLLDLVCVEESCGASYRQRYILTSFTMATALAHYSFLLFLVQAEKMSGPCLVYREKV